MTAHMQRRMNVFGSTISFPKYLLFRDPLNCSYSPLKCTKGSKTLFEGTQHWSLKFRSGISFNCTAPSRQCRIPSGDAPQQGSPVWAPANLQGSTHGFGGFQRARGQRVAAAAALGAEVWRGGGRVVDVGHHVMVPPLLLGAVSIVRVTRRGPPERGICKTKTQHGPCHPAAGLGHTAPQLLGTGTETQSQPRLNTHPGEQ